MILKTIYLALINKLGTDLGLKQIDLFNHQFENESIEDPLAFPCIYIEFLPINWVNQGNKVKTADLQFILHLGQESIPETGSRETASMRNQGLAHLNLVEQVVKLLEGFTQPGFSGLINTIIEPGNKHDGVIIHKIHYQTFITETAFKNNTTLLSNVKAKVLLDIPPNVPNPPLELNIEKP
jgi:hypothetical protein